MYSHIHVLILLNMCLILLYIPLYVWHTATYVSDTAIRASEQLILLYIPLYVRHTATYVSDTAIRAPELPPQAARIRRPARATHSPVRHTT
jgi:hypothetical protein